MAGHCEVCHHHHGHEKHCSYAHPSYPPTAQHYAPAPVEPVGELVSVFTEANPNYRLTVRSDGAVLAFKNSRDINQQWIKLDMGVGKGAFVDREGQPGFILVNKATGLPLKHGSQAKDVVTTHRQVYGTNFLDGSIIWSFGKKDEGHGFRGMRSVFNINLNLEADHADKAHGGVRDGNRLLVSHWRPFENFKWKIEPVERSAHGFECKHAQLLVILRSFELTDSLSRLFDAELQINPNGACCLSGLQALSPSDYIV